MPDEFQLTTIAVGHGDATLGRWSPATGSPFVFLVDGGPKAAAPATTGVIREAAPEGLNLLVLSHVDADHIDGLLQIAEDIPIGSYWGPCLAAFERYSWLFPERVQTGLRKGRELEHMLRGKGTELLCPLEGWTDRSNDGALELQVLNPPSKLYERLLVGDDGLDLLLQHPTPLGWLFEREDDAEQSSDIVQLKDFLRSARAFDPGTLPPAPAHPPISDAEREEALRRYLATSGNDVEFFGTNCLNDTSIVLWISVLLDGQVRRTFLLPGDLENWLYVLGRNARGLMVDVLKAPHHGGRMYVGGTVSYDDVFQLLRPGATIVSANGSYNLPRTEFREAAGRWSRALFCPCTRKREILTTSAAVADVASCNGLYECGKEQRNVTLRFQSSLIDSNVPACSRTPGSDSIPVVSIRQHIIDPSPVLDRLLEGELGRYFRWLKKELKAIHVARTKRGLGDAGVGAVTFEHLATLARQHELHALANRYLRFVLSEGWKRHHFWSSPQNRYSTNDITAYVLPAVSELAAISEWLDSMLFVGFAVPADRAEVDSSTLMASVDVRGLAREVSRRFRFPESSFKETIWPTVSKHLEGWHRYLSLDGTAVLFSRTNTVQAINDSLSRRSVACFDTYSLSGYGRDAQIRDYEGQPFFAVGFSERSGDPQRVLNEVLKVKQGEGNKCWLTLLEARFRLSS